MSTLGLSITAEKIEGFGHGGKRQSGKKIIGRLIGERARYVITITYHALSSSVSLERRYRSGDSPTLMILYCHGLLIFLKS